MEQTLTNPLLSTIVDLQRPISDAITAWGMAAIAALMSAAWIALFARRHARDGKAVAVFFIVVVLATFAGDRLGWFAHQDLFPPPFVAMNFLILLTVLLVGLGYVGQIGSSLVKSLHVETLVALQIFRLPLELLMLRAASLQIMPVEFSMLGYNLDVLTGLGALLITIYCAWTRSLPLKVIWAWNLMGIVCLVVIAVLAVLTSPNVHAFGIAPQHINSWVLYFPYSLLPSVLVSVAVLGHVLLTRKLMTEKHSLPGLRWIKSALRNHVLFLALLFPLAFLLTSAALAQDSPVGTWQSIDDTTDKPRVSS